MAKQQPPFQYKKGHIIFDNIPLKEIIERVKTPFYLYSAQTLLKNYYEFLHTALEKQVSSPLICFALKANPNIHLLKALAKIGSGADIVSIGELRQALKSGIPAEKIVFSGVGKTDEEIEEALMASEEGIYSFNVESIEELKSISKIAGRLGKVARVAFRLNPQIIAKTHRHISTGNKTHKFGLVKEDILKALEQRSLWKHVKLCGISMHIGSQLTCLKATKDAFKNLVALVKEIDYPLEFVDIGGGLGIDYSPNDDAQTFSIERYMTLVYKEVVKPLKEYSPRIVFEPGRILAARAGIFVTKVIRTKKSGDHFFAIVDGGMNDFVRTSLYDAYHEILPVKLNKKEPIKTDIVGPICETADKFATGRMIQELKIGDQILIADTGAYGFSMASNYNLRQLPNEVTVNTNGKLKIN